jgi:hypothetical protein
LSASGRESEQTASEECIKGDKTPRVEEKDCEPVKQNFGHELLIILARVPWRNPTFENLKLVSIS